MGCAMGFDQRYGQLIYIELNPSPLKPYEESEGGDMANWTYM